MKAFCNFHSFKNPAGPENTIRFNKAKCKVLCLAWGSPQHPYRLGDEQTKSSPAEKDLGVLMEERLDMTQQCAETSSQSKKQACVLGCMQSSLASTWKEGILLCPHDTTIRKATQLHKNSVYKRKAFDRLS